MNEVYLLTGGNLGNRMAYLKEAEKLIDMECGQIIKSSSIYLTAPWGFTDQPEFYNQALQLQTTLSPKLLLEGILGIEKRAGRMRFEKLGPRIIDIDILLYNDEVINTPSLIVPHPRLHERRFALAPLAEIAAGKIHPVFQKTIGQLLLECKDTLAVHKIPKNDT